MCYYFERLLCSEAEETYRRVQSNGGGADRWHETHFAYAGFGCIHDVSERDMWSNRYGKSIVDSIQPVHVQHTNIHA